MLATDFFGEQGKDLELGLVLQRVVLEKQLGSLNRSINLRRSYLSRGDTRTMENRKWASSWLMISH